MIENERENMRIYVRKRGSFKSEESSSALKMLCSTPNSQRNLPPSEIRTYDF